MDCRPCCSKSFNSALPSKVEKPEISTIGNPEGDDKVSSSVEYIQVRVITCDLTNEVHFRLKAEVEMIRMKKAYCKKLGHEVGEIRFVFDGLRITDSDTPKSLGLVDDDVIEVYQERTGGGM
ncbi:hypothetical protein ACI65C_003653 [Semiaphis heraclei]